MCIFFKSTASAILNEIEQHLLMYGAIAIQKQLLIIKSSIRLMEVIIVMVLTCSQIHDMPDK